MIPYRPKDLFQKNVTDREEFSKLAGNAVLQRAIAYAQAELAFAGYGPHHMEGATGFIIVLLNMSEADPINKPLPIKHLTSFDPPVTPTPEKK